MYEVISRYYNNNNLHKPLSTDFYVLAIDIVKCFVVFLFFFKLLLLKKYIYCFLMLIYMNILHHEITLLFLYFFIIIINNFFYCFLMLIYMNILHNKIILCFIQRPAQ